LYLLGCNRRAIGAAIEVQLYLNLSRFKCFISTVQWVNANLQPLITLALGTHLFAAFCLGISILHTHTQSHSGNLNYLTSHTHTRLALIEFFRFFQ